MIYFVSDTHFYHKKIMQYSPWRQRWNSVEEMNEGLIKIWNNQVKPEDTVYFLGDFSFGSSKKVKAIIERLNGKKIMFLGNHDRYPEFYLRNGFSEVYSGHRIITIEDEGRKKAVVVGHFPYKHTFFEMIKYFLFDAKMLRFMDLHPIDDGLPMIHGHVHDFWGIKRNMINAGIDSPLAHKTSDVHFLNESDIFYYLKTK